MISFRELVKSYRHELRWRRSEAFTLQLSCEIRPGACCALLGHNGAGKTTAIRLLLGLLRPDSGALFFGERPITAADRAEIGYMPETQKLPYGLSCLEVLQLQGSIMLPQHSRRQREALLEAKLRALGLWSQRNQRVAALSKGLGRKLAWAVASLHAPRLYVLDEPFSGLDPLQRQLLLEQLQAEKTRGATLLLCTHEFASVAALVDEVKVLRAGRLAFSGLGSFREAELLPYYVQNDEGGA